MSELGVWQPLTATEVAHIFEGFLLPWWVAGPHAIDAFLGRDRSDHGDIEIGVLRRDQAEVQDTLSGWALEAVDPPGALRQWVDGEELPESVTEVWCRRSKDAAWGLRLSLEEADDDHWEFRWMPAVSRPLTSIVWRQEGVPYLAPEVQLLYEAGKRSPQSEADFADCLAHLSEYQRTSLALMLRIAHPGHPWIERLVAFSQSA